jgi:hypothetical protein
MLVSASDKPEPIGSAMVVELAADEIALVSGGYEHKHLAGIKYEDVAVPTVSPQLGNSGGTMR